MPTPSTRSFTGFGFGPIQSALFLFEAYRSGNFDSFTVAEIDQSLVDAVRGNGGRYSINIAHADGIEQVTVEGVTLLNPGVDEDRKALIEAIADADEMATALPSVKFFDVGESSVAKLIAEGMKARSTGKPAIVYAAENNNHAAEILRGDIEKHAPPTLVQHLQVLNTVVGKMSGVIDDPATIERLGLATLTPSTKKAVLVEAFNRILVSRVQLPGFVRGIEVFAEKDDLLPFEEAKLYGHNAIHALIGYLGKQRGLTTMAEARGHDDIMTIARQAFIDESGAALCRKYATLNDELFTPSGYEAYADDLLERMVNPYLDDRVDRVIRDPRRKLGYDDRLYGTMRVCLSQGVEPRQMARGAAAAVRYLCDEEERDVPGDREGLAALLSEVWGEAADEDGETLIALTWAAMA